MKVFILFYVSKLSVKILGNKYDVVAGFSTLEISIRANCILRERLYDWIRRLLTALHCSFDGPLGTDDATMV